MQTGDVLSGKYQIVRRLGQGGMGAVYEARHLGTGRRVAVKVILGRNVRDQPGLLARFQREARAAGIIESQHVAQVLDMGSDTSSGDPYLVMELLAGRDLENAIQGLGPLSPALVLKIAAQAAMGLAKAHDAGVIHRDIKSANVFLARRDADEIVVKLLDFGVAKITEDRFSSGAAVSLTQSGTVLGSPYYMSPEQAQGSKTIDHRTDIWSLGVVLYEALTGATPFAHCETLGPLINAIYYEEPKAIVDASPWVPRETAALVHKALARDPKARFQSASEMFEAAKALLRGGHALQESMFVRLSDAQRGTLTTTARMPSTPAPAPVASSFATGDGVTVPRPRSRRRLALPAAALGVSLLVGGGIAVRQLGHRPAIATTATASASPALSVEVAASTAVAPAAPAAVEPSSAPLPSSAPSAAIAAPSATPVIAPRAPRPAPPASPSSKPARNDVYNQMY